MFSNNFRATVELRERTNFEPKIKNGEAENYFGRGVYPSIVSCTTQNPCLSFNIDQIDPTGALAMARVTVQAYYPNNGPHTTRVVLNGHDLGQISGINQVPYFGDLYLPVDFLVEGENILQLATIEPTNTDFFNSIKRSLAPWSVFFAAGIRPADAGEL